MFNQLVIASHNLKKAKEIEALLAPFQLHCDTLASYEFDAVEETGTSFIENALLKAKYAAKHTNLPALADDSGIVVPSLGDAPGVYSARYAGEAASDTENNEKLLVNLTPTHNRSAYFVCVLVLVQSENDPLPIIAEGLWHGHIADGPLGDGGFGYDPLFIPNGYTCSAAQLKPTEKNAISHRALAFHQLTKILNERF